MSKLVAPGRAIVLYEIDSPAGRLMVRMGNFGRTPKINGNAGRAHYPFAYSVALAGGGIQGGQVYGSSDESGAFPSSRPCRPKDLHATVFRALGIPTGAVLHDP